MARTSRLTPVVDPTDRFVDLAGQLGLARPVSRLPAEELRRVIEDGKTGKRALWILRETWRSILP